MTKNQKTVLAICLAGGFLSALPALASLVPINNPSFEVPIVGAASPYYEFGFAGSGAIPGWTISGPGVAGVWNPSRYYPSTPAPTGDQTGFIGDGELFGGATTVSQILTTDLQPYTTYTLRIAVGAQPGYNPGTDYSISLFAGAALLSSVTPATPPTTGQSPAWEYISTTYTSGAVVSGDPLEIAISTPAPQLLFDNVSLSATAVPEPTTLISGALLLLPFGARTLRILRRSRVG